MATYIVFSHKEGEKPDIKVFGRRADASSYAKALIDNEVDTADLYEVDATDARAAKAALEMGEGHFIETHNKRTPTREIKKEKRRRMTAEEFEKLLKLIG